MNQKPTNEHNVKVVDILIFNMFFLCKSSGGGYEWGVWF